MKSGEERARKHTGATVQFSTSPKIVFFLIDAVAPGAEMQLWVLEAGVIPEQEIVTIPLCQNSQGPDGIACNFSHLAKLRLAEYWYTA